MLPVVVVDKPDSVMIPKIPLELHTSGHMVRQEMNWKLVVYAAIFPFVKKGLPH